MNEITTSQTANITALVLAGGKGSRLEGQDKGLVPVNNRPLVTYVMDRVAPQVGQLIISANRNLPTYAILGYETVSDSFQPGEYAGPLAGILAGLEACKTGLILTIPCDTPNLPSDLAERMLALMQEKQVDMVTVHDGERLQPIIMLMKTSIKEGLGQWLAEGNRAVRAWLETQNRAVLQDSNPEAYINLNTEADFQQFAQTLCE